MEHIFGPGLSGLLKCYYCIEIKWYLFDLQTNWNVFACSCACIGANRCQSHSQSAHAIPKKLCRYEFSMHTDSPTFSLRCVCVFISIRSFKFVSIWRILESSVCGIIGFFVSFFLSSCTSNYSSLTCTLIASQKCHSVNQHRSCFCHFHSLVFVCHLSLIPPINPCLSLCLVAEVWHDNAISWHFA